MAKLAITLMLTRFNLKSLLIGHAVVAMSLAIIAHRLDVGANQFGREQKAIAKLDVYGITVTTRPTKDCLVRWCLPKLSARVHTVHIPDISVVAGSGEEVVEAVKMFDELFWVLGRSSAESWCAGSDWQFGEQTLRQELPGKIILVSPPRLN